MAGLLGKIFKNRNEGIIKKLSPLVEDANAFEPELKSMSDEDLKGMTVKLRARLDAGETLDDLLPIAFAAVREAAWRNIRLRRPWRRLSLRAYCPNFRHHCLTVS